MGAGLDGSALTFTHGVLVSRSHWEREGFALLGVALGFSARSVFTLAREEILQMSLLGSDSSLGIVESESPETPADVLPARNRGR